MKRTFTYLLTGYLFPANRPFFSIAILVLVSALLAGGLTHRRTEVQSAIGAGLAIAGVDFPASKECGHFNVIARLTIQNTGDVALDGINASLDLGSAGQFGSAFAGMVPDGGPKIVSSTAAVNPAPNAGFLGTGQVFQPGTGQLLPGQRLVVQWVFEVDPEAAGAPAAPHMQALATALAAGTPVEDFSDSGASPLGSNPTAPGDQGTEEDPTPLGDCWQHSKLIAGNDVVNITADENCTITLTPDMVIEGHFPACDLDGLPLGGFYRLFYLGKEITGPLDVSTSIDQQLTIMIRAVNNACEPVWSYIVPEDKTPPSVVCPKDVHGLIKFRDKDGNLRFRPAEKPGEAKEGEVFNRLVCTDIDSIYQQDRSWKDPKYKYYTGFPEVIEACGNYRLVNVTETLTERTCDDNRAPEGRQYAAVLVRTFTFADAKGNQASCSQSIYFYRPYLFLPECKVELDLCRYSGVAADLTPQGLKSAPFFINGVCDTLLLLDHTCNFTVDFEDKFFPGPEGCGYKLVRTWTILDWCWQEKDYLDLVGKPGGYNECPQSPDWLGKKLTYEQHIIVTDKDAPKVTCPGPDKNGDGKPDDLIIIAGPFDCTGTVVAPEPLVKGECNEWEWEFELHGYVYDPKRMMTRYEHIGTSTGHMLAQVPVGQYDLTYVVKDVCGNVGRSEPCTVMVRDSINPVAICNDDLNVSVGGDDIARVAAADVDEGSWDNCGNVRLHVRRSIGEDCLDAYTNAVAAGKALAQLKKVTNQSAGRTEYYDGDSLLITLEGGVFYSWWADVAIFTCCDISTDTADRERIELRVTDSGGNANRCWLSVRIEDKIPPRCQVENAEILCTELDFDPTDPAQVAARFGAADEVVTVLDNCGATVSEAVVYKPGNCGQGRIERRFTVTDHRGLTSQCVQTIIIQEVNEYQVRFPGDVTIEGCGGQPDRDITSESLGCDILAIQRDTARYPAVDEECFKWQITYKVINWCEYDGITLTPTVIPRDVDTDGDLDEDTWLEARFETAKFLADNYPLCSGVWPAEGAFVVKVFAADKDGNRKALPEKIMLRANCTDNVTHVGYLVYRYDPATKCYKVYCGPKETGNLCANLNYAEQCWTPGFFSYTQIVKVFDQDPPTMEGLPDDLSFCAYGDPAVDCDGQVDIPFLLTDACTPQTVTLRQVQLLIDRDPGQVKTVDDGLFVISRSGNEYALRGRLPVGQHRFTLQATDGCGNQNGWTIDFEVVDCKSPAPICINGIGIELMPVDTDGDGTVDGGMNTVWATDFIASEVLDCAGPVTYSINRVGETPDRTKTSLTVSCADPLYETLPVEIYAWDAYGNADNCETFFLVQDQNFLCDDPVGQGGIAGVVATEDQRPVDRVQVQLSGTEERVALTGADGAYRFDGLAEGYDYSVQAARQDAALNGVTTFDMIQISKHILGVRRLDSPYKILAADANGSKSITTLDLITLRKLILNITPDFGANPSWRFVRADHVFSDPDNPWKDADATVININNLNGTVENAHFIAVKVGDVNNTAAANTFQAVLPRNIAGTFYLDMEDQILYPGEEYAVPVTADNLADIQGFQGTLSFDPEAVEWVAIEHGLVQEENVGLFADRSLITLSWNSPGLLLPTSPRPWSGRLPTSLFTLVLRANTETRLSEALRLSSQRTPAEAYDQDDNLLDVALRFQEPQRAEGQVQLYPNRPNPFSGETVIGFSLPQAGEAALLLHDARGQLLRRLPGYYEAGYHELRLDGLDLPGGLLYYTLQTDEGMLTRKMIRMKW